jgi:hypothetical protein
MIRNAAERSRSRRYGLAPHIGFVALLAVACSDSTEPRRAVALAIATQPPSTAQSGVAFTQSPVVELRDQDDAAFAQAGVAVTVAMIEDGVLAGMLTRTTDAQGRAMFPDLTITGTVGARTLRFSASGLTAVTSTSVTLTAGPVVSVNRFRRPPFRRRSTPPSLHCRRSSRRTGAGTRYPGWW